MRWSTGIIFSNTHKVSLPSSNLSSPKVQNPRHREISWSSRDVYPSEGFPPLWSEHCTLYGYNTVHIKRGVSVWLIWPACLLACLPVCFNIPDNCQSRQSRRECKNVQVRGIFPYWMRKGPCVILHTVCSLHTFYSFSVCNFAQCVILHKVCNFTHSV